MTRTATPTPAPRIIVRMYVDGYAAVIASAAAREYGIPTPAADEVYVDRKGEVYAGSMYLGYMTRDEAARDVLVLDRKPVQTLPEAVREATDSIGRGTPAEVSCVPPEGLCKSNVERDAYASGHGLGVTHARTGDVGDWSPERCEPMEAELKALADDFGPFGTPLHGRVQRGYEDGYLAAMTADGTIRRWGTDPNGSH